MKKEFNMETKQPSVIKYIDLFAGVGGFRHGIKNSGKNAICVYSNEWDKYANSVYKKHYGECDNRDIREVKAEDIPDFDLLCGGFPCQSFSIAGKRGGFSDTRGTLFFEIARIIEQKQPRLLLLENVKGILSHDKGRTFATIIATLDELGYDAQWQVLNSKNFGVPQNRERVFIIGHLRGTRRPEVFPILKGSQSNLKYSGGVISAREQWLKDGKSFSRNFSQGQRIYDASGISQCLAGNAGGQGGKTGLYAMQWRRTKKGREARKENQKKGIDYTSFSKGHRELVPKPGKPVGTITAQAVAKDSLLGNDTQIRRLTPIETERLQGFPDNWTSVGHEDQKISDTQRYKMMGNAVTTNVVTAIISRLVNIP